MNKPFYGDGLQFECTQCHACCRHDPGYVFLSREDLARLCTHFALDESDFIQKFCRWEDLGDGPVLCLLEKKNFDCIFWDGGCTVYPARPTQCRTYPFWPNPLKSAENWKGEARFCPGIGRGKLHTENEISAALKLRSDNPVLRKAEF